MTLEYSLKFNFGDFGKDKILMAKKENGYIIFLIKLMEYPIETWSIFISIFIFVILMD